MVLLVVTVEESAGGFRFHCRVGDLIIVADVQFVVVFTAGCHGGEANAYVVMFFSERVKKKVECQFEIRSQSVNIFFSVFVNFCSLSLSLFLSLSANDQSM